jgi:hypothetical protein
MMTMMMKNMAMIMMMIMRTVGLLVVVEALVTQRILVAPVAVSLALKAPVTMEPMCQVWAARRPTEVHLVLVEPDQRTPVVAVVVTGVATALGRVASLVGAAHLDTQAAAVDLVGLPQTFNLLITHKATAQATDSSLLQRRKNRSYRAQVI